MKNNYLIRSLAVWLVIIFAESLHGTARTFLLAPIIGDFRARQVSVFTGALIIFAVTFFFIAWIAARNKAEHFKVGICWVILTVIFEIALGRFAMNLSWERIFSDYKIWEGGLMGIGLIFMLFTPILAAKLRKLI